MAQSGRASLTRPTAVADGNDQANWNGRLGERINQPILNYRQGAAELGQYFMATNPTPGTGIALTTSITAYDATAGAKGLGLVIKNTETATETTSKRIIMDYIRVKPITQLPTSATDWRFLTVLDLGTRYASGGSAITPVNVSSDASTASVAGVYFGAITGTAATSSLRILKEILLRQQIPVLLDQYTVIFGGNVGAPMVTAAGVQNLYYDHPPVVIGPNYALCVHMFGTSNAAASQWEFDIGWIEK